VKLVVGLGNPGPRYAESRHNIGFQVVDELARRWAVGVARYDRDFQGLVVRTTACGQEVLLLKPTTFVNLSGRSVAAVRGFYKLALPDLLVVYDDLDLPVGQLRLRAGGSAGGHKGMEDIIRQLASDQIPRLRIGIGKVCPQATVEYVLSRFEPEERPIVAAALGRAADAVECWLSRGLEPAMNQFNRRANGGPEERSPQGDRPSKGD